MKFEFTVSVEVERVQGKFAGKDEIEEAIQEALDDANPSTIGGVGADGDSEYEVTDWSVGTVVKKKL